MAANPFTETAPIIVNKALVAQSDPEIMSGATWFWWIAGLSIVNSVMIHSGSETTLAIGLAVTLLADIIFKEYQLIAFGVDALALGVIFALGFMARRGHFWAFVTGIVLYLLDGVIYVLMQSWMAVALHGLALFYMIRGAAKLRSALKAAAEPPPAITPPVVSA
jgi:hypothetical protein